MARDVRATITGVSKCIQNRMLTPITRLVHAHNEPIPSPAHHNPAPPPSHQPRLATRPRTHAPPPTRRAGSGTCARAHAAVSARAFRSGSRRGSAQLASNMPAGAGAGAGTTASAASAMYVWYGSAAPARLSVRQGRGGYERKGRTGGLVRRLRNPAERELTGVQKLRVCRRVHAALRAQYLPHSVRQPTNLA
jgi:hypothetical protein